MSKAATKKAPKTNSKADIVSNGAMNGTSKREVPPTVTLRNKPGRMVYYFGKTQVEGDATMKSTLGGKGAYLADMNSIGLPVGRCLRPD